MRGVGAGRRMHPIWIYDRQCGSSFKLWRSEVIDAVA